MYKDCFHASSFKNDVHVYLVLLKKRRPLFFLQILTREHHEFDFLDFDKKYQRQKNWTAVGFEPQPKKLLRRQCIHCTTGDTD